MKDFTKGVATALLVFALTFLAHQVITLRADLVNLEQNTIMGFEQTAAANARIITHFNKLVDLVVKTRCQCNELEGGPCQGGLCPTSEGKVVQNR